MSRSKYIFVTGGVSSSLGKGISAASLGKLLKARGLVVGMLKCDPYINVDPGTMNPYQHGEVYVTEDGAETDLDLGHYERFLSQTMGRENNVTAGQVYESVIAKERRGDFLGTTVQVIPHITDEIKRRFRKVASGCDAVIIEIGGTVGDIESLPFLEAARQMKLDEGKENVLYLHVTLIPYLRYSDELKTKPTQHSVGKLREIGIDPDFVLCRSEKSLSPEIKSKIALFCSVPKEAVIEAPDVASIYEVPLILKNQKLDEMVLRALKSKNKKQDLKSWNALVGRLKNPRHDVTVALAGKYTELKDAYKSLGEALVHGGLACESKVHVEYMDVETPSLESSLQGVDGIVIPGGFGDRGIEGKIKVARYARENKTPFLGICLGMQCAVIEVARNILGFNAAHSTEFDPKTRHPVISLLPEQKRVNLKGGSMRLGSWPCRIRQGTLARRAYGKALILERHRHRYELNNSYRGRLKKAGLAVSGSEPKRNLAEIVELKNHPWYVAVQFHPEFKSRPEKPHPLFREFIKACLRQKTAGLSASGGRQGRLSN